MGLLAAPEKSLWPLKEKCDLGPFFFLFDLFSLKLCNSVGNEFLASQGRALHDGEKAAHDSRMGNLALHHVY